MRKGKIKTWCCGYIIFYLIFLAIFMSFHNSELILAIEYGTIFYFIFTLLPFILLLFDIPFGENFYITP